MPGHRFWPMALVMRGRWQWLFVLAFACSVVMLRGLAPRAAAAQAVHVPPTVEKLTIAVEAWGGDSLNPVHAKTVNFLWANFLLFLVSRDEQANVVPALATTREAGGGRQRGGVMQ